MCSFCQFFNGIILLPTSRHCHNWLKLGNNICWHATCHSFWRCPMSRTCQVWRKFLYRTGVRIMTHLFCQILRFRPCKSLILKVKILAFSGIHKIIDLKTQFSVGCSRYYNLLVFLLHRHFNTRAVASYFELIRRTRA